MLKTGLAFAVGYLVGAIPVGLLVPLGLKRVDVRRYGTGNIGAANVRESAGLVAGLVVALGVFLQGLLPPLILRFLGAPEAMVAACAIGAVVGYGWPIFLRFRGGRALGTGTGAAAAISPGGFLVLLASYAIGALFGQTSLGTLLGFVAYAAYVSCFAGSAAHDLAALSLLTIIVLRRLEGLGRDLEYGPFFRTLLNLLLFQRRPERPRTTEARRDN